jgi:uncharacterized membrane protein
MKPWFVFGLLASLLYGVSAVLFRVLTDHRFLAGRPAWVLAGLGTGILFCGVLGILLWPSSDQSGATTRALAWAIPVGLLNGFATLLVLWLMRSPSTNISQLVPIYNTNTLVAFVLAVVFLRELPHASDLLRNLAGALLIVMGTILIGLR